MKLKVLFHGFSNASVWYLSGLTWWELRSRWNCRT